uniref:DUF5523 domain-containing protein n=1 Tax=Gasterosteus aculeatus aculeatus TaxID=481459 RepID=G3PLR0_GASAC
MASSSDFREKLRKKRRALQETLVKSQKEDDAQEPQSGEEDPGETLKQTLRAQRQRRKKQLLDRSPAQETQDDDDVEISANRQHGEDGGSAEKATDPVGLSRPPTGSHSGPSPRVHLSPDSHLDSVVTRRLEERLRAARSKGETLQQQEAPLEPVSRLQSLRDRDTVTRFDREVDPERAGRRDDPPVLSSRVKFREAPRRSEKSLPTAEEAYNFFTLDFEPDPVDGTEKKSKKRDKQRRVAEEDGDEEDAEEEEECVEDALQENEDRSEEAPLVRDEADDLFAVGQSSQDFLEVRRAEYVGYRKRVQRESGLLFTPSFRTAPASIKLPENTKPRYLEDEGLYVGQRPPVSPANENILENRVLKMEEGKKWFGDDGRIIALPDPIKESSTRPPLFHMEEDLDPALQPVYRKALQSNNANLFMAGAADPEGDYQLDVDVSGLIFSHHPLFSREHVLAARLAQLYDQYLTRQANNLTSHLTDKIHGGESLTQAMLQRISEYSLEVRETRQLRDSEQEKDRTLLKNMVKVWKETKALRDLQKYTNTPYKLFLRRENVDQASDEREHEEEILSEVMEREAEMEETYQRKLVEYEKQLEEWKLWRRRQKAKKKKRKKRRRRKLWHRMTRRMMMMMMMKSGRRANQTRPLRKAPPGRSPRRGPTWPLWSSGSERRPPGYAGSPGSPS